MRETNASSHMFSLFQSHEIYDLYDESYLLSTKAGLWTHMHFEFLEWHGKLLYFSRFDEFRHKS